MDEKELLLQIKGQFEEVISKKGFLTKKEMDEAVTLQMKAFEGLDALQLKGLLDPDKGVMSILRKQGEELTALKEKGVKPPAKDFKMVLHEKMGDIEKIFKTKSGEVVLNIKAASIMSMDNIVNGEEYLPEDLIESFSQGAFVEKRQPREYLADIANVRTVGEISQYKTWLEEGDTEGGFALVAEGGLKPLISMGLVRNHSEYKKIAAKYVVTEEVTKFRKEAYAIIKRLINQKLTRDYNALLAIDLIADAAPYTGSALDGQFVLPTDYHAIAAVAAQEEALEFSPNVLIMNPGDKWRIGMLQGNDGHFYLTIPTTDPSGQTRLMGFLVRTSTRIPVGNFILGEAGLWEVEQESITVRIGHGITVVGGTSNGGGNVTDVQGDLDHNRIRVIVEQYFHNYIASPNIGSFVYANFNNVKAQIADGAS
jgi:hypothetical protein